jgi:hypothetical protein
MRRIVNAGLRLLRPKNKLAQAASLPAYFRTGLAGEHEIAESLRGPQAM